MKKILFILFFCIVLVGVYYFVYRQKSKDGGVGDTTQNYSGASLSNNDLESDLQYKRFVYTQDFFHFGNSADELEYKYKGHIEFEYPSKYELLKGGCRNYYSPTSGRYCVNIGGIGLGELNLELFDLGNSYQRDEFDLKTSNHKILSSQTIQDVGYKLTKYTTEADTSPASGYDTEATVYNAEIGNVGIRFTIWNSYKLSVDRLSTLEKEIIQVVGSATVN